MDDPTVVIRLVPILQWSFALDIAFPILIVWSIMSIRYLYGLSVPNRFPEKEIAYIGTTQHQATRLYSHRRKWGRDVEMRVLATGRPAYINGLEERAIQAFNTRTPCGLNIAIGGSGGLVDDRFRFREMTIDDWASRPKPHRTRPLIRQVTGFEGLSEIELLRRIKLIPPESKLLVSSQRLINEHRWRLVESKTENGKYFGA
jgi:hypothetical protein